MSGHEAAASISAADFDGVIFDMDGVVTDTARVHASAWKRMFDDYLKERSIKTGEPFVEFDPESDYLKYVDGKPRFDGAKSFFESRGIHLLEGSTDDPPEAETVWGLSMRKQGYFMESLASLGAEAYPGTLALIDELHAAGIATAIITASRNCSEVLASAGVGDIFSARVDGNTAAELDLRGKPAPDVFVEAASRLGVSVERSVVVEDAQAGVAAGRAGGFGLVIGVDRVGQRDELTEMGADVVVSDLDEVAVVVEEARSVETRPMRELPNAMGEIDAIRGLLAGRKAVFFLDYDGTLTPIVERPEDALMADAVRDIVRALSEVTTVAIVSGRDVSFVREQVRLDDVVYAGSHGFDIVGPVELDPEKLGTFEALVPAVDAAEAALRASLASIEGANVERKKFSVAAHYRQVTDADVARVTQAVEAVVEGDDRLRVGLGKKVYEVRPDIEWDKGTAVSWLFDVFGFDAATAVPFYVGDDVTDEDAFAALQPRGVGIAVGAADRLSAATYRVDDTDRVADFLAAMTDIAGGS